MLHCIGDPGDEASNITSQGKGSDGAGRKIANRVLNGEMVREHASD
jgi:hypothetical protein